MQTRKLFWPSTLCSPGRPFFLKKRNHWFFTSDRYISQLVVNCPWFPVLCSPGSLLQGETNDFNFSGMKLPLNYLLYNLSTYCVNNGKTKKNIVQAHKEWIFAKKERTRKSTWMHLKLVLYTTQCYFFSVSIGMLFVLWIHTFVVRWD